MKRVGEDNTHLSVNKQNSWVVFKCSGEWNGVRKDIPSLEGEGCIHFFACKTPCNG